MHARAREAAEPSGPTFLHPKRTQRTLVRVDLATSRSCHSDPGTNIQTTSFGPSLHELSNRFPAKKPRYVSYSTLPVVAAKICCHPYQPLTTKVGGQTRPSWSHSVTPLWVGPDMTTTARGVPGVPISIFCPLHCTSSGSPK